MSAKDMFKENMSGFNWDNYAHDVKMSTFNDFYKGLTAEQKEKFELIAKVLSHKESEYC